MSENEEIRLVRTTYPAYCGIDACGILAGSVNHLIHNRINPVHVKVNEPNMSMNDVAVEVVKKEGETR